MPWTAETFKKHKEKMTKAEARKGARMANSILKNCLADGKGQETCERIAIATTLKRLGSKRLLK